MCVVNIANIIVLLVSIFCARSFSALPIKHLQYTDGTRK